MHTGRTVSGSSKQFVAWGKRRKEDPFCKIVYTALRYKIISQPYMPYYQLHWPHCWHWCPLIYVCVTSY